jgi:hypothetical protein
VLPPYYFTPDAAHPNKPTSPCNIAGKENYSGGSQGLDNDGDGIYDLLDPQCAGAAATATPTAVAATPTLTATPTRTATPVLTATPTRTATPVLTATPTRTATPVLTATPTRTATGTAATTKTPTVTATPTLTVATTPTLTPTVVPTPSESKETQGCQQGIIKAAAAFLQAKTRALQKCENGRVKGKITVPCPDTKTIDAINAAQRKLDDGIAKACCGKDKACTGTGDDQPLVDVGWNIGTCPNLENATCNNTITNAADISTCLGCIGAVAVDQVMSLYYGSLHSSDPNSDKALNKCQQTIGKSAAIFLIAKSRALQRCWVSVSKGKATGVCPAADGKAEFAIAKAEAKKINSICKACGGGGDKKPQDGHCETPASALDPQAGIGFVPTCPAVQVPGGLDCGAIGTVDTLDKLIACIDCVTEFKVDCADRSAVPAFIPQYPPECNP